VRGNEAERANRRTRGAVVEEESGENRMGRESDEGVGAELGGEGSAFGFDAGVGGSVPADILSFSDVCLVSARILRIQSCFDRFGFWGQFWDLAFGG
jgi:hypothetical protein